MSQAKLLAFYPKNILAPNRFLAAMVPAGEVRMSTWLDGMSDRVQSMLDKEFFKSRAAERACKQLGCSTCIDLNNFGEHIVKGELDFATWINCSITGDNPFPVNVSEQDLDAMVSIEGTDLKTWVGLASLVLSGELIKGYARAGKVKES